MKDDGSALADVTQGDSFDDDPSWVPTPPKDGKCVHELVFSSAGIGRNEAGQFAGLGPRAVMLLDAEHGTLATLVGDEKHDYCAPRMAADGTLYCVRRPYVPPFQRPGAGSALKDAALFPFRLGSALVSYLDFFTMRYSGKSLTQSSGSAQERAADARRMLEMGNLARAAAQKQRAAADPPADARVPPSWELVSVRPKEPPAVVASRVATFDLAPNGDIVFTDGDALFLRRTAERAAQQVAKLPYVTDLAALG